MTFKYEHQVPPVIWVVVADRSRSRILSASWPDPVEWEEIADLIHAEGAMKASEINTDRQGMLGEQSGRQHVGEPRTDFKHSTAERFADEIVQYLEDARVHNKFGKLGLVCPPLFLGVLRKRLTDPLGNLVIWELDKDYTHEAVKDLTAHLAAEFAS